MNKFLFAALAVAMVTLSVGCNSQALPGPNPNVTKENFDKIKIGMSHDEVRSILGDSWKISQTDNLELKGVSVAAIREWSAGEDTRTSVQIGFRDGKVAAINATGL